MYLRCVVGRRVRKECVLLERLDAVSFFPSFLSPLFFFVGLGGVELSGGDGP